MKKIIFFLFILFSINSLIAQNAFVSGTVKNSKREPVQGVSISYENGQGTTTDENGEYFIEIPARQELVLVFSHVSFNNLYKKVKIPKRRTFRYSPTMSYKTEEIDEVTIQDHRKIAKGITNLKARKLKNIPGPTAGIENLLMTFAGVNNNNELSTQYNVRGGNFDENLVYVNGIEVYRPFLVRSGQQEGLSFLNIEMTQDIDFSAGGFQAKYGDKLSSVLSITYRKPTKTETNVNLTLLGGSATFEGQFLDKKLSAITSARYRNNQLLVNSKDTETNYKPLFADIQTFLSYKLNKKWTLDFLGNFSVNDYNYQPISRRTKFGTLSNPIELVVFYQGNENDKFVTLFGALNATYRVNDDMKINITTSAYNTQEEEFFDIIGAYSLNQINQDETSDNFGEKEFSRGIGGQINHSRNELDALIQNIKIQFSTRDDENHYEGGIKFQKENIRESINEWEVLDSTGFAIRPIEHTVINRQPNEPYAGPIEPYQSIRGNNNVTINRATGFLQWSKRSVWKDHDVWYNLGIRAHYWNVISDNFTSENQSTISPRGQFSIKPNWEKDMMFRVSGGWYHQPPSYRELKNFEGQINTDVKAQESFHFVLGNDYSFQMWGRPFKLTTEAYFKSLSDVNAYTIDNVRIRYRADNVTTAKASGLDVRLNGEFVPGNESWVSLGLLSTTENINNQGDIARPTDQRFKLGILFQDYVPTIPDLKVYLNLVYNSPLPGGSPSYNDPYEFQTRLTSYKRADVGFSYIIVDGKKKYEKGFLKNFKELNVGLEIFNIFDIQNSNTNTWVRDAYSKQVYGVPNYMTSRVLSAKLAMKF
ncbi:TonB-dependent receptor [Flavicella sediminum]|uniref:TonB-dependent receptor n=1 Tax=Flavicella sediminum TaxID=2585141 RepID=UPI00111E1B53|nr:TonB-dependent receptor [Flavicella sediminum]